MDFTELFHYSHILMQTALDFKTRSIVSTLFAFFFTNLKQIINES